MTAAPDLEARKTATRAWFESLRDRICQAFETIEDQAPADLYGDAPGRFVFTPWERAEGGGGSGGDRGQRGVDHGRAEAEPGRRQEAGLTDGCRLKGLRGFDRRTTHVQRMYIACT